MHRIFTIGELVRRIVEEYINTKPALSLAEEHKALVQLACVEPFSFSALDILWKDASIWQLQALAGFQPRLAALTVKDAFEEGNPGRSATISRLVRYTRSIKRILPILGIIPEPLLYTLTECPDLAPLTLYCAAGKVGDEQRAKAANAYAYLVKPSVRTIYLYVEYDQPFPWSSIIPILPQNLNCLHILPMVSLTKDSDAPPPISMDDTSAFLAAFSSNRDYLHTLGLRFFNKNITNMLLSCLGRLPKLAQFTIAHPRSSTLSEEELGSTERKKLVVSTEGNIDSSWPALKTLVMRDYPLGAAQRLLGSCISPSLNSVSLRVNEPEEGYHLSDLLDKLCQRKPISLTSFRFEGGTIPDGDSIADVEKIYQSLARITTLRSLYLDCSHVVRNTHNGHLDSINSSMPQLQCLHLTSMTEKSPYTSNLTIQALNILADHPGLQSVTLELGNNLGVEENTQENRSTSSVKAICLISPQYSSVLALRVSSLFPQSTISEYRFAPYVD